MSFMISQKIFCPTLHEALVIPVSEKKSVF